LGFSHELALIIFIFIDFLQKQYLSKVSQKTSNFHQGLDKILRNKKEWLRKGNKVMEFK